MSMAALICAENWKCPLPLCITQVSCCALSECTACFCCRSTHRMQSALLAVKTMQAMLSTVELTQ